MAKVAARGELYGANVVARSRDLRVVVGVVIRASAVIGDFSAENAPRRGKGKVVVETFPTYPSSHAMM